MNIDLQSFCEGENSIPGFIKTPWSADAFSYATDGRIIVRVPRESGIRETSNAPGVKEFTFTEHDQVSEWIQIPEIPPQRIEVCGACGGCPVTHACEECDGVGSIAMIIVFSVSNYLASDFVMRKVATLPGVLIESNAKNQLDKKCLKFDGGLGYFMPCRHPEFSDPTPEQIKNFKQL